MANKTLKTKGLTAEQRSELTYQNFLKQVEKTQRFYKSRGIKTADIQDAQISRFEFELQKIIRRDAGIKSKNIAREIAQEIVTPYSKNQIGALAGRLYDEDGHIREEAADWLRTEVGMSEDFITKLSSEHKGAIGMARLSKEVSTVYGKLKEKYPDYSTEEIGSMISEYLYGSD